MFFELIAAIVAGVLAAGVVLILNKLSGGRLPKWAMPAAAGAAIIGFAVYMEYTWFARTRATLPEGVEVVLRHDAKSPLRPWTFAFPIVDRFSALDPASIERTDAAPAQRRVELLFFGRWNPPRMVPVVYDCAAPRMAPMLESVEVDADGVVTQADWAPVADGDPVLEILCKEARK